MLLADYAAAVDNKLYISGGGWSINSGVGPLTMALGIKLEVPWTDANIRHRLRLVLMDPDSQPIILEGQSIEAQGEFEVGRPPGVPPGTPLDLAMAFNFQGVPLEGGEYSWHLLIDDEMAARAAFRVIR